MNLTLGVIHYSSVQASERPDYAVRALMALADMPAGRASFQGQFAKLDQWTRRRDISTRSLDQLATDLQGGVYSHIIGYRGTHGAESAVLSFDCDANESDAIYPISITYVTRVSGEMEIAAGIAMAFTLWDVFEPAYGTCIVGEDWKDVSAELSTIPYTLWGVTTDPAEENRLLDLQRLRPLLGLRTRDAAWGNFLGAELVAKLGGALQVKQNAPVVKVQELAGNGLYLQASDVPLLLKTEGYRAALVPLNDYLRPVWVRTT